MRFRAFTLAAAAASFAFSPGFAQEEKGGETVAYHAATIFVDGDTVFHDAYLVVRDGRVLEVVDQAADLPPLTPVRDFGGAVLMPGLVAADSSLAGTGVAQGEHSLGAHRRAADDFNPYQDLNPLLARGVTTFYLSPARDRMVGGRGAVVKAAGASRVLQEESDLRVSLDSSSWFPGTIFEPPLPPSADNPILPGDPQPPESLAGALMVLREQALMAGRYATGAGGGFDPHLQAMGAYLASKHPLRVVANHAGELRGALEIAQLWGRDLVVDGSFAAGQWQGELAQAKASLIYEVPLFPSPGSLPDDWEEPEADALTGLAEAKIPIALTPGPRASWTLLLEAAAVAMSYGLSEAQALNAITRVPAEILGVGDRVGSLRPGRHADFLVLRGRPLDAASSVAAVYVEGERVWAGFQVEEDEVESLVVRAETVWTGAGPLLQNGGEVLVQDGRIVAVGRRVPHPLGAKIVDGGAGSYLTPGFIDLRSGPGHFSTGRGTTKEAIGLLASGSLFDQNWLASARAGVTSMVLAPTSLNKEGSRGALVKTAAVMPKDAFVEGHEVVFFRSGGGDLLQAGENLEKTLKAGKAYFDKWEKYRADRKKWEEEKVGKDETAAAEKDAELRKRLAQGLAAKQKEAEQEEDDSDKEPEEEEKKDVDPVNGLWEATIEDERLPEPVTAHVRLHHEGSRLIGIFSSPDDPSGESLELEGTWNEADQRLHFELAIDFGTVTLDGEIDAPDHMFCRIELAGMGSAEFEAVRIEIGESEQKIAGPKKKRKKKEGPQPPSIQARFEGLRALFEGRAVAFVEANEEEDIRLAVEAFQAYKLPLAILGGSEAHQIADYLKDRGVAVVVSSSLVRRVRLQDRVPAADLQAAGLVTGFQSGGRAGSSLLPRALALATRYGLGAEQALQALTVDAARVLGLDQRIGRLAPGLDGDLILFDGAPLDLQTRVLKVFVNGREVPEK
ncbi:MAG: hypothetical protein DWQ01_20195 [Planctomycetota bacterium]|nr:MAG: hypothetical protein DWQ01_20195 [Planctomycetota bacterium]